MTEYDPRYKTTFSNRWLMQQFVQAFLHDSVTDIMDFESLEMCRQNQSAKTRNTKD